MLYHGGCCSTILNARFMPAHIDYGTAQRLARLVPHSGYVPSPVAAPVRVLIAGDHAALRSCLKTMLELDPHIRVVGEAADDCEMIKTARRTRPDVVLVDLDMRCCDNFDAVAEITEKRLASSVVGLTLYDDEGERSVAKAAGVDLFLEKGVPYKQLINAVRLASANSLNR